MYFKSVYHKDTNTFFTEVISADLSLLKILQLSIVSYNIDLKEEVFRVQENNTGLHTRLQCSGDDILKVKVQNSLCSCQENKLGVDLSEVGP